MTAPARKPARPKKPLSKSKLPMADMSPGAREERIRTYGQGHYDPAEVGRKALESVSNFGVDFFWSICGFAPATPKESTVK